MQLIPYQPGSNCQEESQRQRQQRDPETPSHAGHGQGNQRQHPQCHIGASGLRESHHTKRHPRNQKPTPGAKARCQQQQSTDPDQHRAGNELGVHAIDRFQHKKMIHDHDLNSGQPVSSQQGRKHQACGEPHPTKQTSGQNQINPLDENKKSIAEWLPDLIQQTGRKQVSNPEIES